MTKKQNEKIVYQGKIIEVLQQEVKIGDTSRIFEFARRSPGVRLIIKNKKGNFLITKEYRRELKNWDYRLPGGKVFDTLDEYNKALEMNLDLTQKAKEAAVKEAREEVGILPKNIDLFLVSKAGATVVWDLFYFVINDFEKINQGQDLEVGENISVIEVNPRELKELCFQGKMQEDRSVGVVLRYLYIDFVS